MLFNLRMQALLAIVFTGLCGSAFADFTRKDTVIPNNDPLIHYHGRWDRAPGTWWYVAVCLVSYLLTDSSFASYIGRVQVSN